MDWIIGTFAFATLVSALTLVFALLWENHRQKAIIEQEQAEIQHLFAIQKLAEAEAEAKALVHMTTAISDVRAAAEIDAKTALLAHDIKTAVGQ